MSAQNPLPLPAQTAEKLDRLRQRLGAIAQSGQNVKFASSLGVEDMLLTHEILSRKLPIRIFTLNTGRLHAETLGVLDAIQTRYGVGIEEFSPQGAAVEAYVAQRGLNAFYESLEARKECCGIRKVEPLNRALADATAWLTGQRREQSATRSELAEEELDAARGIPKHNPLADWSEEDVWACARALGFPVNPLHARGYPSIGCEPCTRAIRPGEDARAGRWWWESRDSKECGLHASPFPLRVVAEPSAPAAPLNPHSSF